MQRNDSWLPVQPNYLIRKYTDQIYKVSFFPNGAPSGIRDYSAPHEHYDQKLDQSISRSRRIILELGLCNDWEYFCTFYTAQSSGVSDLGELYCAQTADLPASWLTMPTVGERTFTNLYYYGSFGYTDYTVEYSCVNWRNFDYIDFQIFQRVATIQSISCFIRNSSDPSVYYSVPFEFNYINGDAIGANTYAANGEWLSESLVVPAQSDFTINLRLFIPVEYRNSGSLIISINGLYAMDLRSGLVAIDKVTGYYNIHDYDPSLIKLDEIRKAIEDSLSSSADQNAAAGDFKDQMSSESSSVAQNQEILNNVDKPSSSDLGSIAGADVILDSQGMGLLVQSFLPLTHSDIVLSILTLAATLALVGYVFFGKKK